MQTWLVEMDEALMSDLFAAEGGTLKEQDADRLGIGDLRAYLKLAISHEFACRTSDGLFLGADQLEFVCDTEFNAFATIRDGQELIGINAGVPIILKLFTNAIMRDSSAFRSVGAADGEEWDTSLDKILTHTEGHYNEAEFVEPPKCPERSAIADRMSLIACNQLIFHELGHVAKCHISLCQKITRQPKLSEIEFDSPLPASDDYERIYKIRQALELDADWGGNVQSYVLAQNMGKVEQLLGKTRRDYTEIWAAALYLLFSIFHLYRTREAVIGGPETHPTPTVRLISFFTQTNKSQTKHHGLSIEREAVFRGMREVADWWRRRQLPDFSKTIHPDRIAEEIGLLRAKYDEVWPTLKEMQHERGCKKHSLY